MLIAIVEASKKASKKTPTPWRIPDRILDRILQIQCQSFAALRVTPSGTRHEPFHGGSEPTQPRPPSRPVPGLTLSLLATVPEGITHIPA